MGMMQEIKRTGTCKDTFHPETMTVFSGVSHHALKTGMSIPIGPISELLLMYLFWGTLKTPGINLSGTLHGKIILLILSFGSTFGEEKTVLLTMFCSRNFKFDLCVTVSSFKFA